MSTTLKLLFVGLLSCRLVVAASAETPAPDPSKAEAFFNEALEAQKKQDLPRYRERLERAAELLPDPTRLLYRLAAARWADNDAAGALAAFKLQIDRGFFRDPRKDAELKAWLENPAFKQELERLDALLVPKVASELAFVAAEPDLVEGIAHDPQTGAFYLSTVHRRRIWKRGAGGKTRMIVESAAAGLKAPLGMVFDQKRQLLWVVSAGLPQAAGLAPAQLNHSEVWALDPKTGAAKKNIPAGEGQLWNDIELGPDGTIYLSDPGKARIDRLTPDFRVETLIADAGLRSPGGMALSADGQSLYVADWTHGLARIDLERKKLEWLRPPATATLLGIDGLRRVGSSLIAIQNGVRPHKILRLELASDGRSIVSAQTLENNVPDWDEPTLGVIVADDFYYVGSSHWPRFGEDGTPPVDLDKLKPSEVRRLRLR